MTDYQDRYECYAAIFGPYFAQQLAKASYQELLAACDNPHDPLMRDFAAPQIERVKAIFRLCRLYYPEQVQEPRMIVTTGDLVRLIGPRIANLTDRVIWLLALDASRCVTAEVLVQYGGDPLAPPVMRTVLRHALFKGAVHAFLADYRPVEDLELTQETCDAFLCLREAGALVGVEFCDQVLFNAYGARSVVSRLPPEAQVLVIEREAA